MSKKYIRKHKMIVDWTADEIAECIPYEKFMSKLDWQALYVRLWQCVQNDTKYFWAQLSDDEKIAINKAAKFEWDTNWKDL